MNKTQHIAVAEPVTADFSGDVLSGISPLDVSFTNLSQGDFSTCFWTFGDNSNMYSCDNQRHSYNQGGTYTVTLTVSGLGGSQSATKLNYINVSQASGAAFSADLQQGIAPMDVNFSNLSTGEFDTCLWSFGDGGQSPLCADPAHTYTASGTYTVSLAIDGAGGPDLNTQPSLITVYEPVNAGFSGQPTQGIAPYTVNFSNLSKGDYLTCLWQFGDGGSSNQCDSPSHPYTASGTYTVSLKIDGPGGSTTKTMANYIQVDEATVDFSATPLKGDVPLPVSFQNLSNGHFDTCLWNFGDGTTSDVCQNPSHIYTATGTYDVKLTMDGPSGQKTELKSTHIEVERYLIFAPVVTGSKPKP